MHISFPRYCDKDCILTYKNKVFTWLLFKPSIEVLNTIKELEQTTKNKYPEFYDYAFNSKKIRLMRYTDYLAYWPITMLCENNW